MHLALQKDRCRKEKYGNPKIDRTAIFCLNSGELRFYLFLEACIGAYVYIYICIYQNYIYCKNKIKYHIKYKHNIIQYSNAIYQNIKFINGKQRFICVYIYK